MSIIICQRLQLFGILKEVVLDFEKAISEPEIVVLGSKTSVLDKSKPIAGPNKTTIKIIIRSSLKLKFLSRCSFNN